MAEQPPRDRRPKMMSNAQVIGLATLFTLLVMGAALLLLYFGERPPGGGPPLYVIKADPVEAFVDEPVTLRVRIEDHVGRAVPGFHLLFFRGSSLLDRAISDSDGHAEVRHTFARPGKATVSVIPDADEKANFRLLGGGGTIEVTVLGSPPSAD